MRTYYYNVREMNFLSGLLFYDIKKCELRKRNGSDEGKFWSRLVNELFKEFELDYLETDIINKKAVDMYEKDIGLVRD